MNVVEQEPVCTKMCFLPSYGVCSCWHGNVCVSWTEPEAYLRVLCVQTGDATSALRCTSPWAVTHTGLCQTDFALSLLVFLSLREAGSEWLLPLHRNTRSHGAGHLSPSPDSSRSCGGASPGAAGRTYRSAALGWDGHGHGPFSSIDLCSQGQSEDVGSQIILTAVKPGSSLTCCSPLRGTQMKPFPGRDLQQGVRTICWDLELPQPSTLMRTLTRRQVQGCYINLGCFNSGCKTLYWDAFCSARSLAQLYGCVCTSKKKRLFSGP